MQRDHLLTQEERARVCKYCSTNFRSMRKALGLRQDELAFAVGTTQRHISEIENGKAAVSWTLMLAFSTILVCYPQAWQVDEATAADRLSSDTVDGVKELESLMAGLKTVL